MIGLALLAIGLGVFLLVAAVLTMRDSDRRIP